MKGVKNKLLGSFGDFFVVAENEHRSNGFAFAPGSSQICGDGSKSFKGLSRNVGRQHFVSLPDDRFEFLVHVNYENRIKLTTVGDSTDTANTVLKAKDFPSQTEQNSSSEL